MGILSWRTDFHHQPPTLLDCWCLYLWQGHSPHSGFFWGHFIKLQIILCLHIPIIHSRIYYLWEKTFCGFPTEAIHQTQNDYLRKVLRSPACVMATSVLVTEVPMLVPMMMGTASWTVSTARAHTWFPSTSVLPGLPRDYVYTCRLEDDTHVLKRPCWQLWRRKWMSSGPAGWPEHRWPNQPEGWTAQNCPERCHLLLYLDLLYIGTWKGE